MAFDLLTWGDAYANEPNHERRIAMAYEAIAAGFEVHMQGNSVRVVARTPEALKEAERAIEQHKERTT